MDPLRFLDSGETMLVAEFGQTIDVAVNEQVLALDAALSSQVIEGIHEQVPTFRSLAIHYDPLVIDRATLIARVREVQKSANRVRRAARRWTIPVCYDEGYGEDLSEVARQLRIARDDIIALHTQARYRVHMYGFAPGFIYLGGLPDALTISRRQQPRAPHPKNAVMIAGGMAAIGSVPMPTGWWVIGQAAEQIFNRARDPAFLVAVGDEIQFVAVDAAAFAELHARGTRGDIVATAEGVT